MPSVFCRLTVAYLSLSAINLLGCIGDLAADHKRIVDWIYSLQVEEANGRDL